LSLVSSVADPARDRWEIFFSVAFARLGEAVFRSFLFTRFFIFLA
jgi:hypothetical protein